MDNEGENAKKKKSLNQKKEDGLYKLYRYWIYVVVNTDYGQKCYNYGLASRVEASWRDKDILYVKTKPD